MPNTPILSIILIIHDQHEYLESTLTSIYDNIDFKFELFIVDDASTDESREIITSIIEYQDHIDTFYFEHAEPAGYGIRLQQAFAQISADFLWIPGMLTQLDGQHLAQAIDHLAKHGQSFGSPEDITMPGSTEEWINMIAVGKWPGNHHFLWNLNDLAKHEYYFQPRLNRFHSLELALRTTNTHTKRVASIPSFSKTANPNALEQPDTYERRELLTSLIQMRGVSATHHELAGQILFDEESKPDDVQLDNKEAENHLTKAKTRIENGEVATALNTIDTVLSSDLNNMEALDLKISVLEKMKRYVEASELKFQLKELQDKYTDHQEPTDTYLSSPEKVEESADSSITHVDHQGPEQPEQETEKDPEQEVHPQQNRDRNRSMDADSDSEKEKQIDEEAEDDIVDQDQDQYNYEKHVDEQSRTSNIESETSQFGEEFDHQIEKDLQRLEKKEPNLQLEGLSGPKISIIIPTTLDGKSFLEQCLMTIARHCNAKYTELIIIDNASLDDTYAYLDQLEEDQFFSCTVITNNTNVGFAAACNQGLEAAKGQYVCLMHNDTLLESRAIDEMAALLDQHSDIGIIGPKTNHSVQPKQRIQSGDATADTIDHVTYVGSFCMMFRNSANLRMDEQFSPAFFEDIDLCLQAAKEGWKVSISNDIEVEHQGGISTEQLGLFREGEHYWLNAKKFQQKWDMQPNVLEKDEMAKEPIEQLCDIADIINPYHPEQNLLTRINELLDDETFAQIQKLRFDASQLLPLITIMMVANERQLLRRLEDQLKGDDIPVDLALKLIHFYFKRNIYSRCHHYLDQISDTPQLLQASLYRLNIAIGERNMDAAVHLLNSLMEEYPSNVLLLKAAGDIHAFSGDDNEADKFKKMAKEAAPFLFKKEKHV